MNELIILLTIVMVPLFLVLILTPYLTRKTESFGVSIPEDIYQDTRLVKMRKSYVFWISIVSIITIIIFALSGHYMTSDENVLALILTGLTLCYLFISFIVYLFFHRQMKQIKSEANWAEEKSQRIVIDTTFRNHKLTYSNLWFLISFLLILSTIILTLVYYQQIPDRIPMNYNFSGDITNWAHKTYATALFMPLMQVFMTVIFLGVNIIISKAKQQVSAENPEDSMKRNVVFRKRWSAFLIITGISTIILFTIMQLSLIFSINKTLMTTTTIIFTVGILVGSIVLAITTGQGGSRLKTGVKTDGKVIDRDDDKHWKLGVFYVNKNDPSIFLEKRFGVGWTNNWAHPLSWILFIGIIVIAIGLPLLLTL